MPTVRDIAAILQSLDADTCQAVLEHFPESERNEIECCLAQDLDHDPSLAREYTQELKRALHGDSEMWLHGGPPNGHPGGLEERGWDGAAGFKRSLGTVGDHEDQPGEDAFTGGGTSPSLRAAADPVDEYLSRVPATEIAAAVRDEHPQVIAALLTSWPRRDRDPILWELPPHVRGDVTSRLQPTPAISPGLLGELRDELAQQLMRRARVAEGIGEFDGYSHPASVPREA
ncbi:MAG TPA: hypothetical protein VIY86_09790 [Pirellulaceae bacterium]